MSLERALNLSQAVSRNFTNMVLNHFQKKKKILLSAKVVSHFLNKKKMRFSKVWYLSQGHTARTFWRWDLNLNPENIHALVLRYLSEKKSQSHLSFHYLKKKKKKFLNI